MKGDKEYRVNLMLTAKVVTKCQGIFFVRVHDGFKIYEIIKKIETVCGIGKIEWEHIELIEPTIGCLSIFAYDEVYCGTGDVLLKYKNGKIVGVDRVSE